MLERYAESDEQLLDVPPQRVGEGEPQAGGSSGSSDG
jgi:hypothetical protein